jgi:formylglycine-generating enzyme required for sulfatase activity
VGGAVALVAATLLVARQMVTGRRSEANREIAQRVEQGRRVEAAARQKSERARELRRRAFGAFDALDRQEGESLWRQTRALVPAIDAGYDEAARGLEAAFTLDPSRGEIRAALADVRYEHLLFAEDFRLTGRLPILEERLAAADLDGSRRKALAAPGTLALRTRPAAARVELERYERDAISGRRTAAMLATLDPGGLETALVPGSYRLRVEGPDLARVIYPFEVHRGERVVVDLSLPPASAVPPGFVHVPPGAFWFGDADEEFRAQFLETVPIHLRRTSGYLIAQHETTYADWISFLESVPSTLRAGRPVDGEAPLRTSFRLERVSSGGQPTWQLTVQSGRERYRAHLGEPIVYLGRERDARQDWSRFPVTGVTAEEVERYLAWLRATGAVPGARMCTEVEWERAARGADDRLYPHGDQLRPDEANFDMTYGRVDSAYGPDVVGSFPATRSPFEIDDLAGNVLELVVSSEKANEIVLRGGGFYFTSFTCRSSNREPVPRTFRDRTTGIRVCRSLEAVSATETPEKAPEESPAAGAAAGHGRVDSARRRAHRAKGRFLE